MITELDRQRPGVRAPVRSAAAHHRVGVSLGVSSADCIPRKEVIIRPGATPAAAVRRYVPTGPCFLRCAWLRIPHHRGIITIGIRACTDS